MSNNALLIGTASPQVFPSLQKRPVKHEVIACGEWRVPLLWLALFRQEDLKTWKWPGKDGPPFELRAPVVPRQKVGQRLKEVQSRLTLAAPKVETWNQYLLLLAEAIDSLKSSLKFVTCEWHEITALDPKSFYADVEWLLEFFGGVEARQPIKKLEAFSGTRLNKALRDPAKSTDADFSEQDWKTLGALLGVEWEKELPWTPRPKEKVKAVSVSDLIRQRDVRGVKAAILNKTEIGEGDVARAAVKDSRILKSLLESGGDPNDICPIYNSALVAAFNSRDDVSAKIRMLLDAGADVHHCGFKSKEPVVLFCCFAHGMEFAQEIATLSSTKFLKRFLEWTTSENGHRFIQKNRITWEREFVSLTQKELKKRRR